MSNFGVRDLTAALKAFRTAQASADGIPPYRVFTNKELEAIVKARPTSVAAVQSIPGFGPAKTSKYGEDIAAAVCASSETASPVPAPAPAPTPAMNALQQKVCELVLQKKNMFLTGCPGTGKSFCLNKIIEKFKARDTKFGVTATTGCAALLINGSTVHSFLKIGLAKGTAESMYQKLVYKYQPKLQELKEIEVLIIDEVSMMNAELLEKVSQYLGLIRKRAIPFGGVQIVLVGDFHQLPPVNGKFCFESAIWDAAQLETVVLTEQMRQVGDSTFKDILSRARTGDTTEDDMETLSACDPPETDVKYTKLYSLNTNVDDINNGEMKKLLRQEPKPQSKKFKVGEKESLVLCPGAQVMITRNIDLEAGIVNGTRGVVRSFEKIKFETFVIVTLVGGREYSVGSYEFRDDETDQLLYKAMPLKLAWATTIHKSQGSTIDLLEIDLGTSIFAPGQAYTGLSRAVSLDRVRITSVCPEAFKVNRKVAKFYKNAIVA